MERQAFAFTERFFAAWSNDNMTAMAAMQRSYAANVMYYGKDTPNSRVLGEKTKFVTRWPVRSYVMVPETASVVCMPARRECVVSAVVRWDCRSAERQTNSAGESNFTMDLVQAAGDFQIIAETGATTSRAVTP